MECVPIVRGRIEQSRSGHRRISMVLFRFGHLDYSSSYWAIQLMETDEDTLKGTHCVLLSICTEDKIENVFT